MKTYEIIEKRSVINVVSTDTSGNKIFIPLDPANSDYAEYLRYNAWVEAGNDPDEFWTQSEGLISWLEKATESGCRAR